MKRRLLLLAGILLGLVPGVSHAELSSDLNNMGSFGISLGGMQFFADSDAREYAGDEYGPGGSAQLRPIGKAMFRYRWSQTWALAVETGFGWNSYPDSDDLVLRVIPLTIGLERRIRDISGAAVSACFGGGVYVWGLSREGEYLIDAETQQDYHTADPGLYLGLAGEFHVAPFLTMMGQLTANYIYSAHSNDFRASLGGDDIYADFRIGLHYYFSPLEGLLTKEPE